MADSPIVKRILKERVFAVLRIQRTDKIREVAEALIAGGITTIEITLNSKNAFDAMVSLQKAFPEVLLGAGTVIGYDAAVQAVERGAKFLVSPVTDLDMLAVAKEVGVVSMAGALTPTEAWQAHVAGADFVKLFPLAQLGPGYIKALRGPLDHIRFVPTNGVTPENIAEYFTAGAAAVGIGTPLVSDLDIEHEDFAAIRSRAEMAIKNAKAVK
jgi:2-dehydro-3-deoxyphosphogluconate aldolase/(4S)-4-hydroxy-2-oxoglutarate aldolase